MSDEKKNPERMLPMPVAGDEQPRSYLTSKVGEIRGNAAAAKARADNRYYSELVKTGELAVSFEHTQSELDRAVDRRKNIDLEIADDQEKRKASLQETKNRTAKAIAEAAQVVSQAEAATETANTSKMESLVKQATLKKQLRAIEKANQEEERQDLQEEKTQAETELETVTAKLEGLLMEDTEQAAARKRSLENTQADLQTKLAAIDKKLQELDGEL